jgi:hypothetical protein
LRQPLPEQRPGQEEQEPAMHWFSLGIAVLVATAIIVIGVTYLAVPRTAMRSFGLPLPAEGPNTAWWLRLKGVRDVASGLVLLLLIGAGLPVVLGAALLILALIPTGDMILILTARGSTTRALGVHGSTATLMIVAAIPAIMGIA